MNSENLEAESSFYLVLNLEVDSSREDADDGPDPVEPHELQSVLVNPEHHLETAGH